MWRLKFEGFAHEVAICFYKSLIRKTFFWSDLHNKFFFAIFKMRKITVFVNFIYPPPPPQTQKKKFQTG